MRAQFLTDFEISKTYETLGLSGSFRLGGFPYENFIGNTLLHMLNFEQLCRRVPLNWWLWSSWQWHIHIWIFAGSQTATSGRGERRSTLYVEGVYTVNDKFPEHIAITKVFSPSKNVFNCMLCSYTSNKISHAKDHMICKHAIPTNIKCSYCKKISKNSVTLKQHERKFHKVVDDMDPSYIID